MNPQQPEQPTNNIYGDPLPLADLLNYANISTSDENNAVIWWDETASELWIGVLDNPISEE